jgi:hypothetical protein
MIIKDKLETETLFEDHMKEFRNKFSLLADGLQTDIGSVVETHLGIIRTALNIMRSENAVLECEQDPEFHGKVEAAVRTAKDHIQRIQATIVL